MIDQLRRGLVLLVAHRKELKIVERQDIGLHQQLLAAREEERKQIARELHDSVIQALIGLNYQLAELRAHPPSDLAMHIIDLQRNVRAVVADVRHICMNLRPPALDRRGLIDIVQSYIDELKAQVPFRVVLRIEGDRAQSLDSDVALNIFRVLKEALTNVQKHARAQQVVVQLFVWPDQVSLIVEDDGVGFLIPQLLDDANRDCFGLVGMRERVDLIHGKLEIVSAPGAGTAVYVTVPRHSEVCQQMEREMCYG